MAKKYLVYISSSLDDLKAERKELIRVVSELGAIPITMDAFDLNQDEDRKLIYKTIEECDYFVNITAHKRGAEVGKSFAIAVEYSHAVKMKIPVLALIISEKARWKASKKEKEAAAKKTIDAFRKKLEDHAHEVWTTTSDLRQKALALLSREIHLNPRGGWVHSDEAVSPSVANELCRLLQENETLRSRINIEETGVVKMIKDQVKSTMKKLAATKISLSFYYTEGENWENTQVFRHIKLFRLLTPELSTPKTINEISHFLGNILNPDLEKTVRKDFPTPTNTIKKIMADFIVLKLVKLSDTGGNEAWVTTEFGKETFSVIRLRQMARAQNQEKK